MELNNYLEKYFPKVILKPNLYQQTDLSLHFEFAQDLYQFNSNDELNKEYFNTVYQQAIAIFNDIFSKDDKMFLVTNLYKPNAYLGSRLTKTGLYGKYVKNKKIKYKLKQNALPYVFEDEEEAEQNSTTRFYLECKKEDIDYNSIIKAICNKDFSLQPKLNSKFLLYYPDVFFVNISKGLIYFIYDDRGCEIIAVNKSSLHPLYIKYNGWLAEYTKTEATKLFSDSNNYDSKD